jgi:hypothetical protein
MKGIMFKEELFHQILKGEKTETRRVIKDEKPRYNPGEVVYLKEPYLKKDTGEYLYKFDPLSWWGTDWKWKNKMFMPARAARYFIKITSVEMERLQEITITGIRGEGLRCPEELRRDVEYNYKQWYPEAWKKLWDSINKPPHDWDSNPLVWVYKFTLFHKI